MALFSMRVQVVKRSVGHSAVAAAAYRAGEDLFDERQDRMHEYGRRRGVERAEIMLPEDAPDWCRNIGREALWNSVEEAEKRKDAQTAREIRVMIPRELSPDERVRVVRDFVIKNFVTKGMVADVAWHNKTASDGQDQPHAHIMLTMRPLTATGFGPKVRHDWIADPGGRTHEDGRPVMVASNANSWNDPAYYERCREGWENTANAALDRAGSEQRIDRRSFLERGIARLPEPALRLAWYMKDLYGSMKSRFGHYQVAKHYQAVEKAAAAGFAKHDLSQSPLTPDAAKTASRFFGWFERQLARLEPATPQRGERGLDLGMER